MPVADTSQNTRTIQLRGRVLSEFHAANPYLQINGPRGITPAGVLTEQRINTVPVNLPDIDEPPAAPGSILDGNKTASASTAGLTQIDFTGILDAGGGTGNVPGVLDDAFIPIPMGGMTFNFFGTTYSANISWNSNSALVFGSTFPGNVVSISGTTGRSILLGNYDRLCSGLYYKNTISSDFSITTLLVLYSNYYTDTQSSPVYKYQIRIIKENTGSRRQYIEVCMISSPPSQGYSSDLSVTYPSGSDISGRPIDSNASPIDPTKDSPYNITNGTAFLNPCGSTFATASPSTGTSFVFSSDSTGSVWAFRNNSYVNV